MLVDLRVSISSEHLLVAWRPLHLFTVSGPTAQTPFNGATSRFRTVASASENVLNIMFCCPTALTSMSCRCSVISGVHLARCPAGGLSPKCATHRGRFANLLRRIMPSESFDPSSNYLQGVLQHLLLVLLSLLRQLLATELDVDRCSLTSLVIVGAWPESKPHNSSYASILPRTSFDVG